uniref:DNA/RNA-binding protein KIN17 n=3 Tax=Canis lupus TaxID=9612 RepID=A0A8I3MD28_CANLF
MHQRRDSQAAPKSNRTRVSPAPPARPQTAAPRVPAAAPPQPGLPGASAGQRAQQALRPPAGAARLHPRPRPPDRALPLLAPLPALPQAAIPLRLHGPGREPGDARPREHGAAGAAEGRSDRPHRACAGPSRRARPPRSLPQSRFLPPPTAKPRERWRGLCLPRPHLLPALGPPTQLPSASGWRGAGLGESCRCRWSRWESPISLPRRPLPTGSSPRGFRSCAGTARCARSSAGTREFRNDFLELLRRRFGTKRVHNNIVYNEYISHREHIHMNATQWETLTDFTKWLGREGLCKVDETPKGWYIQYIDRDPETIRRQLELEKKKKQDLDDEEKTAKFIEEQVRRGLEGKEQEAPVFTELSRENDEEKVTFNLNKGACSSAAASSKSSSLGPSALNAIGNAASVKRKESSRSSAQSKEKKKKKSALDEIMEIEEEKKRTARTDHWLQPEIIVKIITKKLGEKYHKKKGVVKEVIDKYTAVVKMIDSGDKLKLDQTHLETVIPAPGKRILVLNGGYRGNEGTLESINEKTFSATIIIETGPLKGRRVEGIQYEDISKLA